LVFSSRVFQKGRSNYHNTHNWPHKNITQFLNGKTGHQNMHLSLGSNQQLAYFHQMPQIYPENKKFYNLPELLNEG